MDPRLDMIFSRRSVRRYIDEPVTAEELQALLEAGMAAPSARNARPWHLVSVTDKDTLTALANAHPYGKMLAQAALAIAVCGDPTISANHWVQDCSAATQNILIAAAGLSLGAVWLGCHPNADREVAIRAVLGIPEDIGVLSLIAIGRPADQPPARTQYTVAQDHRERW